LFFGAAKLSNAVLFLIVTLFAKPVAVDHSDWKIKS